MIVDNKLRALASEKCNAIIDILSGLRLEEKAFILHQLTKSFKDISGIDIHKYIEVITDE